MSTYFSEDFLRSNRLRLHQVMTSVMGLAKQESLMDDHAPLVLIIASSQQSTC